MDDLEGVFKKEISHFIWARYHIKLNPRLTLNFTNFFVNSEGKLDFIQEWGCNKLSLSLRGHT